MTEIRKAKISDAGRMLEIYDFYVRNTAVTFECRTPSVREFTARMEKTLERYPWLAAVRDGRIEGYVCAGPLKSREAYDWSCETSIYLAPDARKQGLGRLLYEALETELERMGILNLYACIGFPEKEDEYLTFNSADFHAHMGYRKVGEFYRCGYKFGRWYSMIWMAKGIGERRDPQPPVRWYADLQALI